VNRRILTRNAGFSVAQVVLSSALLFLLYRVLISHLTIAEVGLWSLVMASTSVARLSEFGLGSGVVKFVANDIGAGNRPHAARTIFMAAVLVLGFVSAAAVLLYSIFLALITTTVPSSDVASATALLPYAVAAFVIAALGNVFLSALDGCQRSDVRAMVQLAGSAIQLVAVYLMVPAGGLQSLGWVQVIQASGVMMIAAGAAIVEVRQPARAWFGWSRGRVKALLTYGGGFQLAAVGQLLIEPAVKALLTLFGGLALTGYYEIANRLVLQIRAVIVSAYQVLIPFVAGISADGKVPKDRLAGIFASCHRTILLLVVPYYALALIAIPGILAVWIGEFDETFLIVSVICVIGWTINTLNAPAYFLYVGIGRLHWTIWSHVVIGICNGLLASILGYLFGGLGVLVGAMSALAIGSLVPTAAFFREHGITARAIFPRAAIWLFCISGSAAAVALMAALYWSGRPDRLAVYLSTLVITSAAILIGLWWHPDSRGLRRELSNAA
jgi:O-antigen/teichoic acid export membrane protein